MDREVRHRRRQPLCQIALFQLQLPVDLRAQLQHPLCIVHHLHREAVDVDHRHLVPLPRRTERADHGLEELEVGAVGADEGWEELHRGVGEVHDEVREVLRDPGEGWPPGLPHRAHAALAESLESDHGRTWFSLVL